MDQPAAPLLRAVRGQSQLRGTVQAAAARHQRERQAAAGHPREGEEIYGLDEGVRTRSKAAKNPERWTNIPLLVKILKLIINELSNLLEASAARQAAPAEWSQDDANDMWEDQEEDDEEEDGLAGHLLSDILATEEDYYEDDEDDDPDALKDPSIRLIWRHISQTSSASSLSSPATLCSRATLTTTRGGFYRPLASRSPSWPGHDPFCSPHWP